MLKLFSAKTQAKVNETVNSCPDCGCHLTGQHWNHCPRCHRELTGRNGCGGCGGCKH